MTLVQGKRVSYHAVYDGHGGIDAVQYTLQHLHLNIAKSTHFATEPARAIEEGFILTDKNFVQKANREVRITSCSVKCSYSFNIVTVRFILYYYEFH